MNPTANESKVARSLLGVYGYSAKWQPENHRPPIGGTGESRPVVGRVTFGLPDWTRSRTHANPPPRSAPPLANGARLTPEERETVAIAKVGAVSTLSDKLVAIIERLAGETVKAADE
jgi:hypothetical protein